jgi:hypothetical protein
VVPARRRLACLDGDYPEPGDSVGPVAARLVTPGMPPVPLGSAPPSEPLPPGGPGPPVRGLAVPREPPDLRRQVLRQLGWASMPLWSLGMLAFGPFLWLAITRRRRWDRAVAMAYIAACAVGVGLVSLSPTVSSSAGDASGGVLFGLAVVGAGHALVACRPRRRDASGRPVISKAYGNVLAESRAGERMDVRNKARKLALKDPALARELRIGRPDLPREYDDGGLVDVNHVPAAVLVSHLNLTAEQAAKVVSVRDQIARFDGPADLEAYADLPAERVDELSGLMIFG